MSAQGFLVQSLPNATITTPYTMQHGTLNVECVMYSAQGVDQVYLVLRLNEIETAIDHSQVATVSVQHAERTYTFQGNSMNEAGLVVRLATSSEKKQAEYLEDIEMFEGLLTQYAGLRRANEAPTFVHSAPSSRAITPPPSHPGAHTGKDLRGQLLIVDQNNGAVVGEVDNQFLVQPQEKGHEGEPVVIELPKGTPVDSDDALTLFVRDIGPGESHWMTTGAAVVSNVITTGTDLFLKGVSSASTYYIAHSKPSEHANSLGPPSLRRAASSSSLNSYGTAQTSTTEKTAGTSKTGTSKPSAALVFLTSENTRKGLAGLHTVSGKAVKVSGKTVETIDGLVRKAVGRKEKTPKPDKRSQTLAPAGYSSQKGMPPPLPGRSPSPSLYSHDGTVGGSEPPPLPPRSLTTKDRVLLSADLILTTIDQSTKKLLDVGGASISAAVGHKYGEQAGHNTTLLTNSARNLVLVYVDVKGIGRSAILKSAGKHWVKARVTNNKPPAQPPRPNLRADTAPSYNSRAPSPGGFTTSPGGYHTSPQPIHQNNLGAYYNQNPAPSYDNKGNDAYYGGYADIGRK